MSGILVLNQDPIDSEASPHVRHLGVEPRSYRQQRLSGTVTGSLFIECHRYEPAYFFLLWPRISYSWCLHLLNLACSLSAISLVKTPSPPLGQMQFPLTESLPFTSWSTWSCRLHPCQTWYQHTIGFRQTHANSGRCTPVSPTLVSNLNQYTIILLHPGTNILLDFHLIVRKDPK